MRMYVSVTDEQHDRITRAAAARGKSASAFLRESALARADLMSNVSLPTAEEQPSLSPHPRHDGYPTEVAPSAYAPTTV